MSYEDHMHRNTHIFSYIPVDNAVFVRALYVLPSVS